MAQFHAAKIVVLLSDATCLLPAEWHNKRLLELHCITVESSVFVQRKLKKIKSIMQSEITGEANLTRPGFDNDFLNIFFYQLYSLKLQGKQISQDLDLTIFFS